MKKFLCIFVFTISFGVSFAASYDQQFSGKGVFDDERDRIAHQQRWCDLTFAEFLHFSDEAELLENYSINRTRVEEYVIDVALAESRHEELARYCFYPEE